MPELLAGTAVSQLKHFAQCNIYSAEEKQLRQTNASAEIYFVLDRLTLAIYERYLAGRQRHGYSRTARETLEMLNRSLPSEHLSLYQQYQQALDFVSGMTDVYLLKTARR